MILEKTINMILSSEKYQAYVSRKRRVRGNGRYKTLDQYVERDLGRKKRRAAYDKEYKVRCREKVNERIRNWRSNNREKANGYLKNYRAKKKLLNGFASVHVQNGNGRSHAG